MPNYQDGKIYKIYNTINDDIYIGSTTQKLCERMRNHRNDHKSKLHFNFPIYKAFREHGVENFFIELIEKCPCNDKDELRKTEGNYIRLLKPSLNVRIDGRSVKEYYNDNRDILLQKQREYNEVNKERIAIRKKEYNEVNKDRDAILRAEKIKCECGCIVARGNLAPHRRTKKHEQLLQTTE